MFMSVSVRLGYGPVNQCRPDDERVHDTDAGAALQDDHGIEIELGDLLAKIVGKPRQPHDEVDQRFLVPRRHPAHAVEELRAAQLAQHAPPPAARVTGAARYATSFSTST